MQPAGKSPDNLYDHAFHADRDARTRDTARKVLGAVFGWLPVASVCDIGCGVGTWLSVARELGAGTIQGFEGPWGREAPLVIEPELIVFQNLDQPISRSQRYDLVMSLEVAEHLPEARAASLVAEMCALGDLVMFSAAVPMQGGTGHANERWQSWWAGKFADQGYAVFDPVRPLIWNDDGVPYWYRQNILVYAREGSQAEAALRQAGLSAPAYLDLVHPALFEHAETNQPARALGRMARRWLGRS